jgi:hypothetical protein
MDLMTSTRNHKPLLMLLDTTKTRRYLDLKEQPTEEDAFTVKIVLTMTVKARDAEHAQILAQHVAAFVPEDADRLSEAFSPVIAAPRDNDSAPSGSARSVTRAEVVAVVPGARG